MSKKLEKIFTHAIALDQNSRLRNEIHCYKDKVYIVNYDRTVILRFDIPKADEFKEPIGFYANDYESPDFYREDDKVIFRTKTNSYLKKKSSRFLDPTNTINLFSKFYTENNKKSIVVSITNEILQVLDKDLGHVEFVHNKDSVHFVQRDLFTENIIEVEPNKTKGFSLLSDDVKVDKFDPLGIRTNDFFALFIFCSKLKMYLNPEGFFLVDGDMYGMKGIVAGCLYDDLGTVNILKYNKDNILECKDEATQEIREIIEQGLPTTGGEKNDGGEEQKIRRSLAQTYSTSTRTTATETKVQRRGRFLRKKEDSEE